MTNGGLSPLWRSTGRLLAGGATAGITRFPIPAILILALSLLSNWLLVTDDPALARLHLVATLSGAAALALAVSVGAEAWGVRRGRRLALSCLATLPIATAIWTADPLAIRASGLIAPSLMAVALLPFVGRGTPDDFWTFSLWTAVGATVAFLSVALFLVAGYAILEMIRALFEIDLGGQWDRHVFVTGFTLVGPLFALGRIPVPGDPSLRFDGDERMVRLVRPLFDWVLVPLVLVAALVLHTYLVRETAARRLPATDLWMPVVFTLLVVLLRVAIHPFRDGAPPATRLFAHVWRALLVLPIATLVAVLQRRWAVEGLTLATYWTGLWTLTLALLVVAWIVPRMRGDVRWIVGLPTLAFALSTFGPWGAESLVARSQTQRLAMLLAQWEFSGRHDQDVIGSIHTTLRQLEMVGRLEETRFLFAPDVIDDPMWARGRGLTASEVRARAGIERPPPGPAEEVPTFGGFQPFVAASNGAGLDLAGYDRAVSLFFDGGERRDDPTDAADWRVRLAGDGRTLLIGRGEAQDRADLAPLLAEFGARRPGQSGVPARADLVTVGGRSLRIQAERAGLTPNAGGAFVHLGATILLRSAEWPDP